MQLIHSLEKLWKQTLSLTCRNFTGIPNYSGRGVPQGPTYSTRLLPSSSKAKDHGEEEALDGREKNLGIYLPDGTITGELNFIVEKL
jgi:hypothetical protein